MNECSIDNANNNLLAQWKKVKIKSIVRTSECLQSKWHFFIINHLMVKINIDISKRNKIYNLLMSNDSKHSFDSIDSMSETFVCVSDIWPSRYIDCFVQHHCIDALWWYLSIECIQFEILRGENGIRLLFAGDPSVWNLCTPLDNLRPIKFVWVHTDFTEFSTQYFWGFGCSFGCSSIFYE